ncbi:MAG TPA: diguanylate cyclase [Streptosporangiaceae bacterium]
METATRRLMLGGVFPLWLAAGAADWYLHRRSKIEETAGPRESLIHHLMLAETGVPVMLGLFCEVNAGVLAAAYGAVGAHSLTALWDQVYAEPRRRVTVLEQHIHSLLEVSPIMAAFLLTALHWDQAGALARRDRSSARFAIRLKRRDSLSARTRLMLLAAVALFGALPYAEEFYRCWRIRPTVDALPAPEEPVTAALQAKSRREAREPEQT